MYIRKIVKGIFTTWIGHGQWTWSEFTNVIPKKRSINLYNHVCNVHSKDVKNEILTEKSR